MRTGLVYDPQFLEHDAGSGHPERPERLVAVVDRLRTTGLWDRLVPIEFDLVEQTTIERLHKPEYVNRCKAACASGQPYLDSVDVGICARSAEIAQLAVGGALAAVDAVMQQRVDNALCLVRPPGHHAEADCAMGFCLFGTVALAADYLISCHGLSRVAIIDWDVHHGNGTQHLLEHRRDILFVSLHEDPRALYPGTGYAHEDGLGDGKGYTLNIPLPPRSGDQVYKQAMRSQVAPKLEAFAPEFILVSAGFDAAAADPLAHMEVSPQGFGWMSHHLREIAGRLCNHRIVSLLEGGYELDALAESVERHVEAMLH